MSKPTSNAVSAAVVRSKGGPFTIEKLQLGEPRADEVLVRIVAAGMCHTDMVVRDQVYPVPQPIVLGHEGAGVVERIGSNVVKVRPGDHVVLTFMSCGHCRFCEQGRPGNCLNFNAHNFSGGRADGSNSLHDDRGPMHDHFFGHPPSARSRWPMNAMSSRCRRKRRWNCSDRSAAVFRPARAPS
jgi:aryl-alcohol dehydrogenase